MSDTLNNFTRNITNNFTNINEGFVSNMVFFIILITVIWLILYIVYLTKLDIMECSYMDNIYGSLDANIKSLNASDSDCSGNLSEYYVKTGYNACSGGNYKDDFVNLCNLKAILKQGVRGLDFEIYSINNQPVVATSTQDDVYIKETYNSVDFASVMDTIKTYAFSSSTSPNYLDPIIIHMRFMSNNQTMYKNLTTLLESYDSLLLGKKYSYENAGHNIGDDKIMKFMGKIIIIVDRSNTSFLENKDFMEFVNLTSNSMFMRAYKYNDIKNNQDIGELTEYNKKNMTIVFPDGGTDPENPNITLCQKSGCQMVAMRYQYVDNYLSQNTAFFDNAGYAFSLKPIELRYVPVAIQEPPK